MAGDQGKHSAENGKKGGRPKSSATLKAQIIRDKMTEHVEKKVEEYFDAWEDLALGHLVEETTLTGGTRVYKKSPDGKALKDILDQTIGKAPQKIDVTTDGEKIETTVPTEVIKATIDFYEQARKDSLKE